MAGISSRGNQIVIKGYNPNYIVERKVNSATLKPGMAVSNYGEATGNLVHPAVTQYPVMGVALEHTADDGLAGSNRDPLDIDTLYVTASVVRVALLGSGMTCLMLLAGQTTTTTIYGGDKLCVDTTSAGYVALTATTTASVSGISEVGKVGMSIERNTGGSTAGVIAVII